jgi:hypothetical protein
MGSAWDILSISTVIEASTGLIATCLPILAPSLRSKRHKRKTSNMNDAQAGSHAVTAEIHVKRITFVEGEKELKLPLES